MSVFKRSIHLVDEFEPPPKKLVSQADGFLKELAKKQVSTATNLHQELARSKEFCKGAELVSLAHYNAGTSSLEQFQESALHFDRIGSLKATGLADDEIHLYLDYLKGEDYVFNKHRNCEEALLKKQIHRINVVVQQHQEKGCTVKDTMPVLKNIEQTSVKPSSNETKLYKFAMENEALKKKSLPSPMDNIKDIEANLLQSLNEEKLPSINKIRRKARKLFNRIRRVGEADSQPSNSADIKTTNTNNTFVTKSKWDEKTSGSPQNPIKPKQLYTCLPQNYYTIKNGAIVKLSNAECQKKDLPLRQKLTEDEIKQMPKFQDYEKGNPSKVLYLRNLSNAVKESDLETVFKNYERHGNVNCKVMKGKMRGQAFVTFPDEVVAAQALDDINGSFIKNKPVIIQFGCGKG